MALKVAANHRRADAEECRKKAARLRKEMDEAEAAALDYDNHAIDMEEAITKLEEVSE